MTNKYVRLLIPHFSVIKKTELFVALFKIFIQHTVAGIEISDFLKKRYSANKKKQGKQVYLISIKWDLQVTWRSGTNQERQNWGTDVLGSVLGAIDQRNAARQTRPGIISRK